MKIKKLHIFIVSLFLLIPFSSFAESELQLTVIGEIKPINTVTLRLVSPYKDVGGTKIFWFEDDILVEDGIGLTSHRVDIGPIGSSVTVAAVLGIPGSLGNQKATMTLSPATVDLIWEAQTAVPPFYKGKALPSHESLIKTFAIPQFGTTTPSSVVNYSWRKNKTITIGEGLNIVSAGLFGAWEKTSDKVQVTARYKDQTSVSEVSIPSFVPTLQFYELSPTQGLLTQESLNASPVRNSIELSLIAVPYGFSNADRNNSKIQYKWTAGKKDIKNGVGQDLETVSLSRSNSALKTGEIVISLLAENIVSVMQFNESKFSWKFTQN